MPKAVLALIPVARVTAATPSGLELPERHLRIRKALTTAPTSFGARAAVVFGGFCFGFFGFVFFKCVQPALTRLISSMAAGLSSDDRSPGGDPV
jgi:hypothetical protein